MKIIECMGGIYTEVSPSFQRGPLKNMSRCLKAEKHDAGVMFKVNEPMIVASRGRNPQNPSDRTPDNHVEQRLEPAILTPKRTEYGKAIRKAYESGAIQESRHNMTELQPRQDGISNTLTTVQKDNLLLEPTYRIRKLTPLECWKLMDFTEEDFYKAEKVNSNTQLYKQAGNSIVKAVLMAIFKQMM